MRRSRAASSGLRVKAGSGGRVKVGTDGRRTAALASWARAAALVLACAFLPLHVHAEGAPPSPNSVQVNQHVVLGVLAAKFHCDTGAWPPDIATLKAKFEHDPARLPVAPDWAWLMQPGARLEAGENFVFFTPGGRPAGAIPITSTHQAPGCGEGKLNPKIDLHFGD